MGQKLLLNTEVFNDLLNTNEVKEQFSTISSEKQWAFRYGKDMLSNEDNIKSLKRFERKLTRNIIAGFLTISNEIRSYNTQDTKRVIRIIGNKLYIKEDIEQGELDYGSEIRNNSTNT